MNLHIVPDSKFTDTFVSNLKSLGLEGNNKVIVRSNTSAFKFIKHGLPSAPLYSRAFRNYCGNTLDYKEVFIHQFSPLMYRWVAWNDFRKINWCIWGADLYNLPGFGKQFYEPYTWSGYARKNQWSNDLLYSLKVYLTNMAFRNTAYKKVTNVLTWMKSEADFAMENLPVRNAQWKFFFYENQVPYEKLDTITSTQDARSAKMMLIVGNSGTDTNNHVDAVHRIQESGVCADLVIPLSYGTPKYISFVKNSLSFYKNGRITYLEKFLEFNEYIQLLMSADGLVMNHIRPQGYGNIFMMMYLNKPVFLNPSNISIPDLDCSGLKWQAISEINKVRSGDVDNKAAVISLLSHEKLEEAYLSLFS